ncbi:MAG: Bax inhibitor-1/YccA family protein [Nannocystaceae bacterium]|nr:Bax inhibitor-1/YccA family protein [Nannocystaceae bacterium]
MTATGAVVRLLVMTGYQQQPHSQQYVGGSQVQLTAGLRQFMAGVYAWMAAGIGLTAAVAVAGSQSDAVLGMMYGPSRMGLTMPGYVIVFAPLIVVMFLRSRMERMSGGGAVATFMGFAALLGLSFSAIPLIYQTASLAKIFLSTVGMFGAMAVLGFVTKKDLTGMGQFLTMALFGAIIASVVNGFFVGSFGMDTVISAVIAIVAAGLTAYHTQSIKQVYLVNGGRGNLAIIGALQLYVDFINLFLSLLRLFGNRN